MMLAIAAHWITLKVSPRKANPDNAASAGSPLISTPNVRVGRRVIAYISSEYGSAVDNIATPHAAGNKAGDRSAAPAFPMPMGTMAMAAANVPSAAV